MADMMESNQTNQPANSESGARRPQFRRETPEYLARQQQPHSLGTLPTEKSWGRVVTEAAVAGTVRATASEVATFLWNLLSNAIMKWITGS